jgi:putative lipoprotein
MSRCSAMVVGVVAVIAFSGSRWAQAQGSSAQTDQAPASQSQATSAQGTITGTVAYRERVALPADAAIDVKLQDVSLQGAPAETIGEALFAPAGQQVPIPFQLSYNPADIDPAHTYQLRANISVNGKMMFTSTTAYSVITKGAPSQATIMLQQVQSPTAATSATKLRDTHWELAELNGRPASRGEGHAPHLVLHAKGGLSGSTGCNNLAGSYIAEQGALQFTPAGTTMKMCSAPVMDQEQALLAALKATTGYRIDGGTLQLLNGQQVLAKFQAVKK